MPQQAGSRKYRHKRSAAAQRATRGAIHQPCARRRRVGGGQHIMSRSGARGNRAAKSNRTRNATACHAGATAHPISHNRWQGQGPHGTTPGNTAHRQVWAGTQPSGRTQAHASREQDRELPAGQGCNTRRRKTAVDRSGSPQNGTECRNGTRGHQPEGKANRAGAKRRPGNSQRRLGQACQRPAGRPAARQGEDYRRVRPQQPERSRGSDGLRRQNARPRTGRPRKSGMRNWQGGSDRARKAAGNGRNAEVQDNKETDKRHRQRGDGAHAGGTQSRPTARPRDARRGPQAGPNPQRGQCSTRGTRASQKSNAEGERAGRAVRPATE